MNCPFQFFFKYETTLNRINFDNVFLMKIRVPAAESFGASNYKSRHGGSAAAAPLDPQPPPPLPPAPYQFYFIELYNIE